MDFSALAGNARIKNQLRTVDSGDALSHAYIIAGASDAERAILAGAITRAALCHGEGNLFPCGVCIPCKKALAGIHPDIMVVGDGEKPISVGEVRQLRSDTYIRPNEGRRKVYLLPRSDRMNASAQNALLKLLEDGPAYALFLLIAENGQGMLETIRSRCERLELVSQSEDETVLTEQGQAILSAILGRDELALFRASMSMEKLGREELASLFAALSRHIARALPTSEHPRRLMAAAELMAQLGAAAALNANPGQLAGWLCGGISDPQLLK